MPAEYVDVWDIIVVDDGVYAPQRDSRLLANALAQCGVATGRRVLDLCSGTGVVAITAARLGARSVTAFDICHRAVRCSRANAHAADVDVDFRIGSIGDALASGPYDVVVCNPPYVPVGPDTEVIPASVGPSWAWDAGDDGRLLLDPLCLYAPGLLARGGTMLLVQSGLSDIERSLASLRLAGLDAEIIEWQCIPFGPVLLARSRWLESTGRLPRGCREEELVLIRAEKP